MKKQRAADIKVYKPTGFIKAYQDLVKKEVIPFQYEVMSDNVEGADKSHVIKNFENAGKTLRGDTDHDGFYGMVFQDSDAGKWLEAVAYSLSVSPDEKLMKKADGLIDLIASSQDSDGYLNTYFTIKDKDKRWTNLLEGHELYTSGHLMEAACAYYEATGKDKLLKVMLENARHIYKIFIEDKKEGYGGHPEIELALLKMYRLTGEKFCLDLAKHFLDVRGVDKDFFRKEAKKRDWCVWGMDPGGNEYNQSHLPVRQQSDAVGHSVRAVYLYTAMSDLAFEEDDEELKSACDRLFESITAKRMYITGAIGSTCHGEAFTTDYDLPSDTVYGETCASIGLMMFSSKMLEGDVDSKYGDIMERAFYNSVLSGMALDGKSFFYVNPLEVNIGISGKICTHNHIKTVRPKWYPCACCPPNLARLITSFGKYAYGENEKTAFCHMYAGGEICFENGLKIRCETEYPYGFTVKYTVLEGEKELALRIPQWSKEASLSVNGKEAEYKQEKGYIYINVKKGDEIILSLSDTPYYVYPSEKIPALTGKAALMRGPLVYCFEGTDNENEVRAVTLDTSENAIVSDKDETLSGAVKIKVKALKAEKTQGLYTLNKPQKKEYTLTAIPYYTWCNRGETDMRVWLLYR